MNNSKIDAVSALNLRNRSIPLPTKSHTQYTEHRLFEIALRRRNLNQELVDLDKELVIMAAHQEKQESNGGGER